MTDEKVVGFATSERDKDALHQVLQKEKQSYRLIKILLVFQFTHLTMPLEQFLHNNKMRKNEIDFIAISLAEELLVKGRKLRDVADKFQKELSRLLEEHSDKQQPSILSQRIDAASQYFSSVLEQSFLKPIRNHRKSVPGKKKLKNYIKELVELEGFFSERIEQMKKVKELVSEIG